MPDDRREVDLLIKHGVTITMDPARRILYASGVAIDDGRIIAVDRDEELDESYVSRRAVNAQGCAILPGLVDTHHHFLQNLLKGARDDLAFPDWVGQVSAPLIKLVVDDYRAGHSTLQCQATLLGCFEALTSGVTTILNMEWATHTDVIDVYEDTGIRAVHTLTLSDIDHWDREGMLLPLAECWSLSDRLIERCRRSTGGRVTFRYGPACENSTSPGLLREVRERASATKIAIHMHIAESKSGWGNIHQRYGLTPVAYLNGLGLLGPDLLGAHCIWLSENDRRVLSDTGTAVAYTPKCHMKLALGVAPIVKFLAEGITVSLGTDTCAVNDNIDLFEEMRSGLFLQRISNMDPLAVSAYQALEMATLGGARALGMDEQIGSLEPGKRADIIVVGLDGVHLRPLNDIIRNLVFAGHASDVRTVLVDGQIVVENHRMCRPGQDEDTDRAEDYVVHRFMEAGLPVSPYYEGRAWKPQKSYSI